MNRIQRGTTTNFRLAKVNSIDLLIINDAAIMNTNKKTWQFLYNVSLNYS